MFPVYPNERLDKLFENLFSNGSVPSITGAYVFR